MSVVTVDECELLRFSNTSFERVTKVIRRTFNKLIHYFEAILHSYYMTMFDSNLVKVLCHKRALTFDYHFC